MKFYKVQILTSDGKKHLEFVAGEDELNAIDKAMKEYKSKNVIDVKVI